MTRKLQKAILKEGQRRSPRISAMEAWRGHGSGSSREGDPPVHSASKKASTCIEKTKRQLDNGQGPAFRTRGRKKRKLRPVEELTASSSVLSPLKQGGKQSDDEDIQKKSDQPPNLPSATFMPEKRILELVLNILQRRDTYEIFAEPVDPKEVEDYYEIIEEPMDFGTMRAKLHEGMYKSLEQFEHDVFLIFNNAMHFNSSGTIYFRQARAINELAKKVFNVLKSNPGNFELEFSETRPRVGRRNHGDFRDSTKTNVKFSESTIGVSSKIMPCSSHAISSRKKFKSNHGRSEIAKHVDARDLEDPMGARDSGRYKSFEVDKRCTYRPSLSLGEDESIFPTVYGKLKRLEHVNQQDIGYRESLMLFVKDLGQAAQNIVRRKLLGCEIHTGSSSAAWIPNTLNTDTALKSENPLNWFPGHPSDEMRRPGDRINFENTSGGETAYVNDDIDHAKVEGTLNAGRGNAHSPLQGNIQGSQRISIGCDKVYNEKSYCSSFYYPRALADKLSCSVDGSKETGNKSARLSLDKSQLTNRVQLSESAIEHPLTLLKSRFENKCELQTRDVSNFIRDKRQFQNPGLDHIRSDSENITAQCPTHEVSCSPEAGKILRSDQTVPMASSFIFNLPYLKTKLHQINSSEHYRPSQLDSGGKKPFSVQVSFQGGLTCNHPTDLCTALNSHNQQPSLLNYQRIDSSPSL